MVDSAAEVGYLQASLTRVAGNCVHKFEHPIFVCRTRLAHMAMEELPLNGFLVNPKCVVRPSYLQSPPFQCMQDAPRGNPTRKSGRPPTVPRPSPTSYIGSSTRQRDAQSKAIH